MQERSLDSVISDEIRARMPWQEGLVFFWQRTYRLPFHVQLVRWFGDREESHETGDEIRLTIPRYWLLWWQTRRARRRCGQLPRAVLTSPSGHG